MADEVKPQPLQPEEIEAIEARCEAASPGPWNRECDAVYTAHECGDTCERTLHDHFVFADPDVKPADADFIAHARTDIPRLLATIEEARREQPVSDAVQAVEALSVMYDEYGGKVPADVLRAILDNFERNAPARREQPVRGTDADSLRATLNTVEFRNEVHPFLIEYVRKFNQTFPVGYSFDSTDRYFWDRVLLVIGDYLAAAPKEARNGG